MDMDPRPQRPLVTRLLRLSPRDGLTDLGLLVGGLGAQSESGTLLSHAGPALADEDHQDQDDEGHHPRRDDGADHDDVGVRDVLQDSDALDVNLTGDAQPDTVVHVTVVSSETFLIEAQFDRTSKTVDGHFTVKSLVSLLPGE